MLSTYNDDFSQICALSKNNTAMNTLNYGTSSPN